MFREIILNLLKERGLNQRQLSVQADIPATTISGWINANRLPDYNTLKKLCLFFDVSADFLLGLTEEY